MAEYSATRRTPRKHKRVVMKALSSLTLTVSNSSPETCRPTNNGNPTTTNASSANCRRIGPFLTSASRSWGALCAPQHCVFRSRQAAENTVSAEGRFRFLPHNGHNRSGLLQLHNLGRGSGGIANDTSRSLPPNAPVASGCRHSSPWRSRPACNQRLRNRQRKPVSPDRRPIHRRRYWPSGLQSP